MKKKNETVEKVSNKKKKVMKPEDIWNEEIEKKEKETKTRFILLEQINPLEEDSESEEEKSQKEVTIERLRSLNHIYIPKSTYESLEDFENFLSEKLDPKGTGIIMNNSSSPKLYLEIFDEKQKKIKKFFASKKYQEIFDLLFSITLIFKDQKFWYMDCKTPKKVEEMMNLLYDQWKLVLKEEIGISTEMKENWKKHLLEFHDEVENCGLDYELKKWKF